MASEGRFGPYVQCGSVFASLKSPDDPLSVTYERALELLDARREQLEKKRLLTFTYE